MKSSESCRACSGRFKIGARLAIEMVSSVEIPVLSYGGGVEAIAGAEVTAKTAVGLTG